MAAGRLSLSRSLSLARGVWGHPYPSSTTSTLARSLSSAAAGDQFLYTKPGLKAKVIDGKKIAAAVKAEVAEEVSPLS